MKRRVTAFALAAVPFIVGGYLAFQATAGDLLSHNRAIDRCAVAPLPKTLVHSGISATDELTWWPPLGHAHHCVYRLRDGRR